MKFDLKEQLKEIRTNKLKTKEAILKLYSNNISEIQIIEFLELGLMGENPKLLQHKSASAIYDQTIEQFLFNKINKYKLILDYKIFYYKENENIFLITIEPKKFEGIFIEYINKNIINLDYFDLNNKLESKAPNTAGIYYSIKQRLFKYFKENNLLGKIFILREVENFKMPFGTEFIREITTNTLNHLIFQTSNEIEYNNYLKNNFKEYFNLKSQYEKKKNDLNSYFKIN